MRTSSKVLSVGIVVAVAVALGSCSRTFGAREDGTDENPGDTTTVTTAAASTSTKAPTTSGKDKSESKTTTTSKPAQGTTDDGFGGNPPSFPAFTFTATRNADGTVTVTGSGCAGGKVSLYPSTSSSGEGGDPFYANPDSAGNFTATAKIPAGQLQGTCFGVGTSGQSHVGGSHTVTIP
ncbi:MAG: hypothetical protein K1X95_00315 [Acidimicrobiia bacterium]|nr:hypothetical protein [Acidimicrobiia bacterium]